ncbi:isopentenyl-diphosphate Delta-isomerase [Sulfitobacter sabulilitoris]|uniref:Isopentenyl-diphosphate Delta-isomerase n=1 Tax=Sulfitobacter sabulilitoris TaxID=2562655 RepID=A0A5S3PAR9_9RHOB|nr:isopentenyl-diphosphate Delta-isomerase [Sulfitobacter sabulilitoris]TMM50541.1 isopentenyl-diphosphate Delta-isomerase [Sulfitobacter sabulilitoris]
MTIMIPAWVNGTLTPVEKLEAHQKGLRHMAVSVFVLRGDEVLLQRRAMGKYHTPGLWTNTCCTHPDWNELPEVCAVRRLDEELGVTGVWPEHRHHLEYRAEVGGGMTEHEVVDVYVAEAAHDLEITPNPDEVMAVEWVPFEDLKNRIVADPGLYTPWLKIYLRDHARMIFGDMATLAVQDPHRAKAG